MFNREKYQQEAVVIGPSVLGDLLRASDADVEALKRAVGWKEEDFYGTTDPARRALTHLLRGRAAANQVQERAHEPGPSWVEAAEKSREGQEWDALASRWVEKGPKTGPAVQWNRTTGA
jgi:hypothetical protein